MLRILRAFAWLRWRMLVNSLEKTGARDTVERFSLAIEKLGPIMAAVLMIPSTIALAILGAAAGYALAAGDAHPLLFQACRFILIPLSILNIVGPLFLPAADRTNPVRLLLLPIPRGTMYLAQTATALGDPWTLLAVPLVLSIPLGLAAGGALLPALTTAAGAILLLITLVGISSVATSLLHLVVRDRRRGELLALLFIILVPAMSMLPGLLAGGGRRHQTRSAEAPPPRQSPVPAWAAATGRRAASLVPSELFVAATTGAVQRDYGSAGAGLLALAATAAALHGAGMLVFARVLRSPGSTGARRAAPMRTIWGRRIPGLSAGASAVALAQFRLALRTPRGRSIMLSPLVILVLFGVMIRQKAGAGGFGPFDLGSGVGLASFASFISLMSILPIAMNQFAVDKAGLTLALLSPLTDRDYLAGKAVGNALIVAPPAIVCSVVPMLVFAGGSPILLLASLAELSAIYLLVAPAAAAISALFPRVVDMNSIGRGSNAHGLAGLLGLLLFVASAAPGIIISTIARRWLHSPPLGLLILLVWCAIAFGLNHLMFVPARALFGRRKENLAMLRTTGSSQ